MLDKFFPNRFRFESAKLSNNYLYSTTAKKAVVTVVAVFVVIEGVVVTAVANVVIKTVVVTFTLKVL